ncbi:unnamed protein product [Caenorhabditis angaria]|uniref:G-protein coupled receptors family 1 profile domain-containing protein n=1 Tax=Caenorhabditis angaria TaxID=860376 RepID=A0A9P1N9M1_9PELO|nr:unnamed protein product [Caenorhabditis angaria]
METGETRNVSTGPQSLEYNYAGLFLIIIPLITLLGNLLVIISVLRFRALQSAINFLILGLAVADLLVAIIVMPYAVYIYVTNGEWGLGDLMCDIYITSDVACSTASILLLAVISFDRYRAVSLPIQYSRQSQNTKRVFAVIAGIWFISLALASPMVLGANVRPPGADTNECRFYNAEFSILSSVISFIIPCILVLFVYIRIIIALKKREKAAKMRREKNCIAQGLTIRNDQADPIDEEAAGRIVAGPVVNVMMAALPSMTRRMRQFERHRRAIELAGDEEWENEMEEFEEYDDYEYDEDEDERGGNGKNKNNKGSIIATTSSHKNSDYHADDGQSAIEASAPRTTSMLRRIINATSPSQNLLPQPQTSSLSNHKESSVFSSSTTSTACDEHPVDASKSPTSTSTLLFKEREFGNSSTPRSSIDSLSETCNVVTNDFVSENCTTMHHLEMEELTPRKFRSLSRNYSTKHHKRNMRNSSLGHDQAFIPSIIRTISRRSPRIFRKNPPKKPSIVLSNPVTEPTEYRKPTRAPLETMSASSTANTAELLASTDIGMITETVFEEDFEPQPTLQPTVSFALTVREMEGDALDCLKGGGTAPSSRKASQIDPLAVKILTRPSLPSLELQRMDSIGTTCSSKTRADSLKSTDSKTSKKSSRNGIAVKLVKKAIKHEHSLKRKVSKAQRKEKRATKTLGVVVGVFLVCWVPFFVINILNAVCSLLEKDFCMVGYDLFFYCTWIGYMNSFMNPIIYTIFNTEFRRAFKSILFGRNSVRAQNFKTHL